MKISIHALREEGDKLKATQTNATLNFYPRPPRGGRPASKRKFRDITKFLSTPSARRATGWEPQDLENLYNFYPRPPRGGRLLDYMGVPTKTAISIHALREEGDCLTPLSMKLSKISIHALREEGDSKNGEKHLRFCFSIKRSAQIWKSFSKNIRKNSCDLHRTA